MGNLFPPQKTITAEVVEIKGSPLISKEPIKITQTTKAITTTTAIPTTTAPKQVLQRIANEDYFKTLNTSFKTYMDYRAITNRKSTQWKMQQEATTDNNGFRIYRGRYMVALGTGFAKCCELKFNITLSSGVVLKVITGDIKANQHTDATNRYVTANKTVLEFIVDQPKISKECRIRGDMSSAGAQGRIVKIEQVV